MRQFILVFLLAVLAACQPSGTGKQLVATDITGADFGHELSLTDHHGQPRSLAEFKGKAVVLFFGYTHCPDVCPTTMAELATIKAQLANLKAEEDQIKADDIAQTVVFDDSDDEDVFEEESELIVQVRKEAPLEPVQENYIESDFEIELGNDPIVEEPIKAPIADEDVLATQLVSEHGEYDPTKDLEGYLLPPLELMKDYVSSGVSVSKEELETNKDRIVETLSHYKIDIAKIKATVGPTVTLYEIVPAPGVRISKIKNLEDDIALSLSALGIRIIAPIPGKGTIGIEVPNSNPEMVSMRSLIASDKFQHFDGELPIVMGKTITNETYVFDLTKMPHLLVAGATGQGRVQHAGAVSLRESCSCSAGSKH